MEVTQATLSALRRELHRYPELALEEHHTAQVIERELDKAGVPHRRIGATGVLATLTGGKGPGPIVALRADIDALPMQEQHETDYCSQVDGKMHACGHDAHTAMLIGAAQTLAARRDALRGEIRFCFQPGEETGKGAEDFLAAGCLHGVSRVFGLHVAPELTVGTIGVTPGLNKAAVDGFHIIIHGKSAHVSTPQLGVDALYIASHIVVALQAQVARRTSPMEPVILGIGKFQSGTTYNALAERAVLEGTTRTISPEARQRTRRQVEETAQQIAALYGGTAEVIWDDICSALVNDPGAAAEVANMIHSQQPELLVDDHRPLTLSGDNFSEYLLQVPGVYAYLGCSHPDKPETHFPIHHNSFDLDEAALPIGTWLYTACAQTWLETLSQHV